MTDSSDRPADIDFGRVWIGVASRVWVRPAGWFERWAGRVLRSPGLARALTTTPSLLVGWLTATVVALAVGVVVTMSTGTAIVPLLAPALAGVGIAYAYGPGVDPAYELARSMPVSDRMVLLVRAVCVFAVNGALGILAAAVSGTAAAITFGWLIPMTAVGAVALAVATVARSAPMGVAVGSAGWALAVLGGIASGGSLSTAVTDTTLYLPYLIIAVAGVAAVLGSHRIRKGLS